MKIQTKLIYSNHIHKYKPSNLQTLKFTQKYYLHIFYMLGLQGQKKRKMKEIALTLM